MEQKGFVTALIVGAILIGVSLTVYQVNSPVMRRLVEQQSQILELQRKLDQRFSGTSGGETGDDLSARIASVEGKLDSILKLARGDGPSDRPQPPQEDFNKVYTIDVGTSPVKGKQNAPITIVEFADFECPFCARFHPAVEEVLAAYPDKVNYILKNFPLPFHPSARPAAKAAMAAGEQGKYYEMAHLILSDNRNLSEEKFQAWAKELGLNEKKFMDDFKNKDAEWEKRIGEDMELAGKVDVQGTPTYYLNGKKTMARDLAAFKTEIDALLAPKP